MGQSDSGGRHQNAVAGPSRRAQKAGRLVPINGFLEGAMKLPHRRQFLHLVAGAAALQAKPRTARSQTYPARPVRIIVGFAAGGGQDIVARLIGQWLSQRLGQTFLVDNRLGANGNIATEAVVKAPSDGYTLLHFSSTAAI